MRIKLLIGDASFDVSQIGGGRLTFSKPVTLPGACGDVVLSIDGQERRWAVTINPTVEPASEVEAAFGPASELSVREGMQG